MIRSATGSDGVPAFVPAAAGQAGAITVVIPTRARGDRIVTTLRTLSRSDYHSFHVLVVDQSTTDSTEIAVKRLADPRVSYIHSSTSGISAALNRGIGAAAGEMIAVTGDDCEVREDWLGNLVAPMAADHRIGIVFGNVLPAAHDRAVGFVPGYERKAPLLASGLNDAHLLGGTSASMALRKSLWNRLRGFDEMLGVGAPLRAAEDTDLTIRALLGGDLVYETPEAIVVHHGFFPWEKQRTLIQRNWYGTGAAFAKSLKQGHFGIVAVLARLGARWAGGQLSPVAASLGNPHRWSVLAAFVHGFMAGLRTPVDRASGHYERLAGPTADVFRK
jgi:GT2 family glycosyltransferase